MGIGVISIATNAKKEGNGAPFPAGSADNGLSVDSGTGRIVLGNNVLGNNAQLLNDRWIPTNGFSVLFVEVPFSVFAQISAQVFGLVSATSNVTLTESSLFINRLNPGDGPANISLSDGVNLATFGMDGNGVYVWNSAIAGQFGAFDMNNGFWQVGFNPGGVFNGAQLEVTGTLTFDYFANTAGGAQSLDAINDKGKLFIDTGGAAAYSLPTAATANVGLHFKFCVQSGGGIVVQSGASSSINIGGVQGVTNGSVSSATVGSFLELVYVGNNQWIAATSLGPWVII